VFSFSFEDRIKGKRKHYGQKKKTTIWSKEKDNTTVKRKRQHYGQKKKTTLWSKEKDNTMVKRKKQHYGQKKKTTLWTKEKDNIVVLLTIVLSFSFDHSVVCSSSIYEL
jgi:hypothetical protein